MSAGVSFLDRHSVLIYLSQKRTTNYPCLATYGGSTILDPYLAHFFHYKSFRTSVRKASVFDHLWSFTCEWKRPQLIISAFAMAIFLGWSWFSFWTVKRFIKSPLCEALNLHFSAAWFTKHCQKLLLSLYYVGGLSWQNKKGVNFVVRMLKKKKKLAINSWVTGKLPRSFCSCTSHSKINKIPL